MHTRSIVSFIMGIVLLFHLMLYITGPDGKPVHGAIIGFMVEGPNQADQKVMAMSMGDGYGADIYLGVPAHTPSGARRLLTTKN